MNPGIQVLELAIGLKDLLASAGFTTIDSVVRLSPSQIASILGIEFYVAKIISDAARRATAQSRNGETENQNFDSSEQLLLLPAD